MDERYTLHIGDCREVMREFEDNSFDAIVTDPPYELGFMCKKWDSSGIAFQVEVWKEALRVAKPGAHLLAFGGTRTHHRLMCAIEDAGWEIRDCLGWVYGCLSEDTELLIDGRWEHYRKAINKGRALCYIPATNEFQWQSIKDFVEYDYDDTAFRILSDSTDQIVSRNHRCLIERCGAFVFEFAEEVALEREARVPILESLSDLLCDLPVPYEGTGFAKQVLQPCLCKSETSEKETARSAQRECGCVLGLREEVLETGCVASQGGDGVLLSGVQRQSAREGMGTTCTQGKVGLDRREHGILRDQDDRSWESGMERWSDLLPQAWQLQTDQVCPMSCGVPADGTQGRLYHGTSTYSCACAREVPEAVRGSSSSESRSTGQQHEQPGTVCQQSGSQTVRGTRYTRTDLARVEPFHYRGKVWCIRVPSGAFVARRNGKVFVTGNSGFPKSLDVSKAIDKATGVDREVVGVEVLSNDMRNSSLLVCKRGQKQPNVRNVTVATSESAKQWQGFGTALKPAYEPIVLARKPLDGTVANNVLKWGCGALNIDGCRVGGEQWNRNTGHKLDIRGGRLVGGERENIPFPPQQSHPSGRFPANILHDGSEDVMRVFPVTKPAKASPRGGTNPNPMDWGNPRHDGDAIKGHNDSGGSAARFFYCAKASRSERGEGNTHATVKPLALMRYLCRLVTPPGGIILDPFCGSGSTGLAALDEGFRFVGIDLDEQNIAISKSRITSMKLKSGEQLWMNLANA